MPSFEQEPNPPATTPEETPQSGEVKDASKDQASNEAESKTSKENQERPAQTKDQKTKPAEKKSEKRGFKEFLANRARKRHARELDKKINRFPENSYEREYYSAIKSYGSLSLEEIEDERRMPSVKAEFDRLDAEAESQALKGVEDREDVHAVLLQHPELGYIITKIDQNLPIEELKILLDNFTPSKEKTDEPTEIEEIAEPEDDTPTRLEFPDRGYALDLVDDPENPGEKRWVLDQFEDKPSAPKSSAVGDDPYLKNHPDAAFEERSERAQKDALDYLYGQRLSEMAQNGQELTMQQQLFVLQNLVDKGAESAIGELMARQNGFRDFGAAAKELKIDSGVYAGQKIITDPKSFSDRLPESVKGALKTLATGGAISLGTLAVLSVIAPPAMPVVVAALGGTAGSAIGKLVAGMLTRDKIYKNGTSKDAFAGMVGNLSEVRGEAAHGLELANNPDFSDAEQALILQKTLNAVVHDKNRGAVEEVQKYRKDLRTAKIWEMVGSVLGGAAGSAAASWSFNWHLARTNGIQIDQGHAASGDKGHLVKFIKGDWHHQYSQADIANYDLHHAGDSATFFSDKAPDVTGNFANGTQDLWQSAHAQGENLFHANLDYSVGTKLHVLKGYLEPAVWNSVLENSVRHGLWGALMGTTAAVSGDVSHGLRARGNELGGKTGFAALYNDDPAIAGQQMPRIRAQVENADGDQPELRERQVIPERDFSHLSDEVRSRISRNLDHILALSQTDSDKRVVSRLMAGEPIVAADKESPSTLDQVLGGFASRQEMLIEAPDRIALMQREIGIRRRTMEVGSQEYLAAERLSGYLTYVTNLFESPTFGSFQSLHEKLLFERLSPFFAKVDAFLFSDDEYVPGDDDDQEISKLLDTVAGKAGIKDLNQIGKNLTNLYSGDNETITELLRWLSLRRDGLTPGQEARRQLVLKKLQDKYWPIREAKFREEQRREAEGDYADIADRFSAEAAANPASKKKKKKNRELESAEKVDAPHKKPFITVEPTSDDLKEVEAAKLRQEEEEDAVQEEEEEES